MKTAILILIAIMPTAGTLAQDQHKPSANNLQQTQETPPHLSSQNQDGLWPTPKLMNSLLLRWTAKLSQQYELDDAQHEELQKEILKRWPAFLQENRRNIQPLVNQFLEMRMAMEPPRKEDVQLWAKHAQPILEGISQQILEGATEVRGVLTPDQRIIFDTDQLQLAAGLQLARTKIQAWEKGDIEPTDFWQPTPQARTQSNDSPSGTPAPPTSVLPNMDALIPIDQITKELSVWDEFVLNFIKRYALNESQQDAARSILTEMKQRALAHRDHNREAINALETSIRQNPGTEKELDTIRKNLVSLYGPIDTMFETLRRRIRAIPTKNQTVPTNGKQHRIE